MQRLTKAQWEAIEAEREALLFLFAAMQRVEKELGRLPAFNHPLNQDDYKRVNRAYNAAHFSVSDAEQVVKRLESRKRQQEKAQRK